MCDEGGGVLDKRQARALACARDNDLPRRGGIPSDFASFFSSFASPQDARDWPFDGFAP